MLTLVAAVLAHGGCYPWSAKAVIAVTEHWRSENCARQQRPPSSLGHAQHGHSATRDFVTNNAGDINVKMSTQQLCAVLNVLSRALSAGYVWVNFIVISVGDMRQDGDVARDVKSSLHRFTSGCCLLDMT